MEVTSATSGSSVTQAQYQVAVAKKGLDVEKFEGESAIKLIQSASIDPKVGRGLDITA